jgi:hypothetical protein
LPQYKFPSQFSILCCILKFSLHSFSYSNHILLILLFYAF